MHMSFLRKSVAALVAVAGVAVAGSASADTVTATFNGVNPGVNVNVQLTTVGSFSGATTAGRFNWTSNGTTAPGNAVGSQSFAPGTQFTTFCIELTQTIANGTQYVYTVDTLAGGLASPSSGPAITAVNAPYIMDLWQQHYGADVINNASGLGAAINAAAFQIATWELVYDAYISAAGINRNVLAGNVQFQSNAGAGLTAVTLAQTWLNGLDGDPGTTNVLALVRDVSQDQSFLVSPAPILETPLPPVMWGGIGLLGMSLVGKLRGSRRNA